MLMYPMNLFYTSESVIEGQPDKFCGRIFDAVLDALVRRIWKGGHHGTQG